MFPSADSKYPNRRAYVVKIQRDASPGALHGRLENILTCEQREFASGLELVELIEAELGESDPAPGAR